jgi:hypothetical protein
MTSELFVTKLGEIITAVPSSATRDRRRAAIAIGLVKANAEDSLRKRASSAKKGGMSGRVP